MGRRMLQKAGKTLWIVTDSGYTKRKFLRPAINAGATVITRLRKDAALHSLPKPARKRKRGRPRKYGKSRIDLRHKAAEKSGWFSVNVTLYGQQETKWVKMFKATYRPAAGQVSVLIVREADFSWRAFMSTNLLAMTVKIEKSHGSFIT